MQLPGIPSSARGTPSDPAETLVFPDRTSPAPPQNQQPPRGGAKADRRPVKLRIDLLSAAYPPRQLPWRLVLAYCVLILLWVFTFFAYKQYVLAVRWADSYESQAASAERELRSAQTINRERNVLNGRLAGYDTQLAQLMGPAAKRGVVADPIRQTTGQISSGSRLAGVIVTGDKLRVTCRAPSAKDATDYAARLERLPVLSGISLRSIQTVTTPAGTPEVEFVVEATVRRQ